LHDIFVKGLERTIILLTILLCCSIIMAFISSSRKFQWQFQQNQPLQISKISRNFINFFIETSIPHL